MQTKIPIHEMNDVQFGRWITCCRDWPENDSKTVPFGGFAIPEKTLRAAWQLQRQSRDGLPIY
jgi:hypothetical protein